MTDFAAIDFETANGHRTSICSVGVVIVRNGAITDNSNNNYNEFKNRF
jgi:DNA polymerase-3 subunit epsilon